MLAQLKLFPWTNVPFTDDISGSKIGSSQGNTHDLQNGASGHNKMAKRNVDDHNSMETKGQWTESDSIPEEVSSYFPKWEIISSERQTLFWINGVLGEWGTCLSFRDRGTDMDRSLWRSVISWNNLHSFLSFHFFLNDPSEQRPDKKTFTDTQLNSYSWFWTCRY